MAAGFTEADCITLEQAEELLADRELASRVLPVEKAFALYTGGFERKQAKMYQNGVKLDPKDPLFPCGGTSRSTGQGHLLGVSAVNRRPAFGNQEFICAGIVKGGTAFDYNRIFEENLPAGPSAIALGLFEGSTEGTRR